MNFFEKSLIKWINPLDALDKLNVLENDLLAGFSYVILSITDIIFVNIELDVVCVYVRHFNMSSTCILLMFVYVCVND